MALRFIESFDFFSTAQLTEGRWTGVGAGVSMTVAVSAGTGRRGTQSVRIVTAGTVKNAGNVRKTLDNQPTWIVGFAFRTTVVGTPACDIFSLRDGGTPQIDLVRNVNATVSVTRNGTVLGTSTAALNDNTFTWIELLATMHPSAGAVELRMNGVTQLALSGINTCATANSYAQELMFGAIRLTNVGSWTPCQDDYDDVYICDGTGAAPYNTFLGDCRVDAVLPTSDALVQWTPSTAGTHWSLVDETPPNTTDYVESTTVGQIDRYGFAALPVLTAPAVLAVAVTSYGINPEAGGRQVAATALSGGVAQDSANIALTNAWRYGQGFFLTNPNGGIPWTQAAVNAASFGVKVTV